MPNYKPIITGEALIEIERIRYNALIATDERYDLIVNYLKRHKGFINIDHLKDLLGIEPEEVER